MSEWTPQKGKENGPCLLASVAVGASSSQQQRWQSSMQPPLQSLALDAPQPADHSHASTERRYDAMHSAN